ncbi:MAG: GNAT family N-acetyltransferase [Alphaproteobacteria bacterium]|nr:MAG: GNAT family N-acetyltransferase [Alphaproteobacteria bacterium]
MATFRPAAEKDLPAIIRLLADDELGATREDPSEPLNSRYIAAFNAIQSDTNQLMLVAEHNAVVIGCLQLTFIPGLTRLGMWRGQIEGVRIAKTERGSGLGRQMFDYAIEQCRNRGCELVQLTTDAQRPDAHGFYEALGFQPTHIGMKLKL